MKASNLKSISFAALSKGDNEATNQLFEAGVEDGFFYLDLRGSETQPLLESVDRLYHVSEDLFSIGEENLMPYDLDVIGPAKIDGYKPAGRNTGVASGKRDGFEIYLISTNQLLGLDGLDYRAPPEVLSTEKDLISYAVDKSHRIGNIILECFSAMLAPRTALQEHHRYGRLSTSALGLLRYPPNEKIDDNKLGQIAHTDVGSITVLFNRLGGLQVLGNDGEWAFVSPRSGHAVINVGDSLRFLSGRCLKSSLHRVVPHPDTQYKPRYSIAYFMRPELDVEFKDDEGVEWTGIGWHTRKFTVFRAPSEEQKKDSVLTGRKGYLGL